MALLPPNNKKYIYMNKKKGGYFYTTMDNHIIDWGKELWVFQLSYAVYMCIRNVFYVFLFAVVTQSIGLGVYYITPKDSKMQGLRPPPAPKYALHYMYIVGVNIIILVASVLLPPTIAYVVDLTKLENGNAAFVVVIVATFLCFRDFCPWWAQYLITFAHALWVFLLSDTFVFGEPWTYGMYYIYSASVLGLIIVGHSIKTPRLHLKGVFFSFLFFSIFWSAFLITWYYALQQNLNPWSTYIY